ncbi:hypothetical protein ASPNIDRAFT_38559 [Aspergillus niger ATCC 1015]|uniref:Uncharacterized protein n=1 Tax=Aspergillus niger (strain ATCC 1015 / CBS 113.46 / FGSC A1144 / LSHB Ac4 / NCTC 3858a / NRRL 328 / USDA 3528.7) TaxID=380704 RepID=G3YFY7_ASPNA|nr:hypothetical protein ASPNIDRAFT_38559 [Aspergillus niger ATCC 1015]
MEHHLTIATQVTGNRRRAGGTWKSRRRQARKFRRAGRALLTQGQKEVNIPGKDLEVVYMMPAHNYHAGRIITNNQCGICLVGKAYEIEGRENAWVAAYHQQVIPLFDSQQVLSSNPSLPLYAQAQKNPLTGDCPNSDVPAALTVMVSGFNSALEIHIPLLPIVILNSNEAVVNS